MRLDYAWQCTHESSSTLLLRSPALLPNDFLGGNVKLRKVQFIHQRCLCIAEADCWHFGLSLANCLLWSFPAAFAFCIHLRLRDVKRLSARSEFVYWRAKNFSLKQVKSAMAFVSIFKLLGELFMSSLTLTDVAVFGVRCEKNDLIWSKEREPFNRPSIPLMTYLRLLN